MPQSASLTQKHEHHASQNRGIGQHMWHTVGPIEKCTAKKSTVQGSTGPTPSVPWTWALLDHKSTMVVTLTDHSGILNSPSLYHAAKPRDTLPVQSSQAPYTNCPAVPEIITDAPAAPVTSQASAPCRPSLRRLFRVSLMGIAWTRGRGKTACSPLQRTPAGANDPQFRNDRNPVRSSRHKTRCCGPRTRAASCIAAAVAGCKCH